MRARRRSSLVRLLIAALAAGPLPSIVAKTAEAVEFFDGRLQVHGYGESQFRMLSDGYHLDRFYVSQWANIFNVEIEADIAPNGFGPFNLVQGYSRIEVRYECVWTRLCGTSRSVDFFGDRGVRAPKNFTDGRTSGVTGILPNPDESSVRIHRDGGRLLSFLSVPPLDSITELGGNNVEATFAPILDARFAIRKYGGTLGPGILPQGPWLPRNTIHPNGVLAGVRNSTIPDLPLRPIITGGPGQGEARGLYVPSRNLREEMERFGGFDQNFSQQELEWNHGAGQDEHELKELYLDLEMLDGRLWFRVGKQSIVWGKTELFRTTDQFNPIDIGLVSLGSLEETRLPLWSVRGVYSFYDVGPLEDVRLELAANIDDFEPTDLGRCGEPYTVFLVCGKSVGLFAHGILGGGLAGEVRPDDPWDDVKGLEFGARLEFRWDRFSFAVTDFWGYSDNPTARVFNRYERKVDPQSGRPLDVDGRVLDPNDPSTRERAVTHSAQNRQFFDLFCSATIGVAGSVLPTVNLDDECALSLFNSQKQVIAGVPIAQALGLALSGEPGGELVAIAIIASLGGTPPAFGSNFLQDLNYNGGQLPGNGITGGLTATQQALLGCGPYYGTNCTTQGIDLYNAEASVLLQSFPQFEPGGPVATRFVNGRIITLPGARGPSDPLYDPRVGGCVDRTHDGLAPPGFCAGSAQNLLALGYRNELGVVSTNLLTTLALLGDAGATDPNCSQAEPLNCALVRAIFGAAGTQRPDRIAAGNGIYGRRDFFWHAGSELEIVYNKRNVLGFSADFAEDVSKTNWGVELTWVNGENYVNNKQFIGYTENPTYNLTVSVDRPTFINFLNANRTFLFNMQWFFRYIDRYERTSMPINGPFAALGTFTVLTAYFQDRLLVPLTFVHDISSNSGGVIGQVTYRYSEVFSISFGAATFYGNPEKQRVPLAPAILGNNGGSFNERTKFEGLSPLAERDEVSLTLRYSF